MNDLLAGTILRGHSSQLDGRRVLLTVRDQLTAALAMIELDGLVSRLVICTPDLDREYVPAVLAKGEVDAIVTDAAGCEQDGLGAPATVICGTDISPADADRSVPLPTEWVLLTSGTTGAPKMVVHSVDSLTAPVRKQQESGVVWGTFYDIRRYGGLQILLRALLGCSNFAIAGPDETLPEYLMRLGRHGVTHLSGTPSHWRRVLMSPCASLISPRYIRLSGEIADQMILDALHDRYPHAAISHAFATTEAGVGFEVTDGLEGFPAHLVTSRSNVEVRITEDSLRIRSACMASTVLGEENGLLDDEGFIDTGDLVERRGDRYYFMGRRNGVINVGGLKVYPEEIEAILNRHPAVRMSMVRARRNSITGSLVTADVVLRQASSHGANCAREILQFCHDALPPHKVPATIRCVAALDVTPAGKLARVYA